MTAIADMTCAALADAYRTGTLSPVEVVRIDTLARIERHAVFNAFRGRRAAHRAGGGNPSLEARWRSGRAAWAPSTACRPPSRTISGPRTSPTRRGSQDQRSRRKAEADSLGDRAAARAGHAVILGKTTMPEHGWIGACHSPLTGVTRNPWNKASTRPAAPPVAGRWRRCLGLGLLHPRHRWRGLPAHSGGIHRGVRHQAELRPGAGLPGAAVLTFCRIKGPITRTVADAAAMLSVIARPDHRARPGGVEYFGAGSDATAWMTACLRLAGRVVMPTRSCRDARS